MFGKISDVIVLGSTIDHYLFPTHFSPVQTDGEECEDIKGDAEESYEVVDFAQNCSEYPDSEKSYK